MIWTSKKYWWSIQIRKNEVSGVLWYEIDVKKMNTKFFLENPEVKAKSKWILKKVSEPVEWINQAHDRNQ